MAKLTAATRNALPAKDFAGPDRSFPIPDKPHARAALSRAAAKGEDSPIDERVERKVAQKFPGIKQKKSKFPSIASSYVT